jgi:hypothetical protein
MAEPKPNVEFACLNQLVFVLIQGLGPTPDNQEQTASDGLPDIQRLLDSLPSIPQPARTGILRQLSVKAAAQSVIRYQPGLIPLLQEEHEFPNNSADLDGEPLAGIKRTLSPYLLHDTLILDLESTLNRAAVASLHSCRVSLPSSLGQCFFLFVQADTASDELAHTLGHDALGVGDSQPIKAELLGSPIWEFVQHGISYYVWIRPSRELDGDEVAHIYNRLCCRAKIEYAVQQAADAYKRGLVHYQQIEDCLSAIHPLEPTTNGEERAKRMAILEKILSSLPLHSHNLARCERDLGSYRLLLTNSQANAHRSAAYLPSTDTFLKAYFAEDCAIHLRQIEHDLNVLSPGRRYADQAIEAIRAMVGLDSQKLQMERQEQENNREQHLRKDLAIVGSGLAVSSIAASTRSRPTEKFLTHRVPDYAKSPYKPWPEILWLADIVILALLGLLSAFLVAHLWPFISIPRARDTPRVKPLEDSQPPIDLPADVCGDAADVGMGAGDDLPAEGAREMPR